MMLRDDHLHTRYSDGVDTPRDMIEESIRLGYCGITFTDHVRKDSDWVDRYIEELRHLREEYEERIDIRIGIECKLVDFEGNIDCPDHLLRSPDIDIVAAIHRIPRGNCEYIRRDEIVNDPDMAVDCFFKTSRGIMNNGRITRFAHPFSLFDSLGIKDTDADIWEDIDQILQSIGIPFEYNAKYDNSFVPKQIWTKYSDRIVLGSDSHSVIDLRNRSAELRAFVDSFLR